MMYHQPVLLQECIDGLKIRKDGVYVDVTYGGGGHSKAILNQLGENGKLLAFDQDRDAAKNLISDKRLLFAPQNFCFLKNYIALYELQQVDGILADLGVSSHQFDEGTRGFSIRFDAELDMRMNQDASLSAKEIVNTYPVTKLKQILKEFGEVDNPGRIASQIEQSRIIAPINTTFELMNCLQSVAPKKNEKQFFAQVFQALRIEVNREFEVLEQFLNQALEVLLPGGRLVVISYHSIEDRMVKNFLKSGNVHGVIKKDFYGNIFRPFNLISKKPIVPSITEIENNPRARSAKLRIGEKK